MKSDVDERCVASVTERAAAKAKAGAAPTAVVVATCQRSTAYRCAAEAVHLSWPPVARVPKAGCHGAGAAAGMRAGEWSRAD